ncbi:hypothetical protein GALL_497770 [mine drainage metagenome]|uniref:Uncharacterized protein n=1 Tax=mine drainage metagenome TaxID=410659 RepID=A0A1J5PM23_9ZZZZ
MALEILQNPSVVDQCIDIVRTDLQRSLKTSGRLVQGTTLLVYHAQVVVRIGIIWIFRQRPIEERSCKIQIANGKSHDAEQVEGGGMLGSHLEYPLAYRNGIIDPAGVEMPGGEIDRLRDSTVGMNICRHRRGRFHATVLEFPAAATGAGIITANFS